MNSKIIVLGILAVFASMLLIAAHAASSSTYYFIIEKKENPAGGAISYAYHWMWYEKDREPSTNTLGIPIQLKEVSIEGFKQALAPYLNMHSIQDLQIYYEDSYCWKLKGTCADTTASYAPPPSYTRTTSTTATITSTATTETPQGIGDLPLELFIIAVVAIILLVLLH